MSTLNRKLKDAQRAHVELLVSKYGPVVTRKQILAESTTPETKKIGDFIIRLKSFRAKWGNYNLESVLLSSDAVLGKTAVMQDATNESASVPL